MTDLTAFHDLCRNNALGWKIEYSDGDGMFELHVWGIGEGEDFYVKRCTYLEDGIGYILKMMKASGLKFQGLP